MTLAQLVQAMEEPATQDMRGYELLPTALQGDRRADRARSSQDAIATLRAWHADGAHRRDLDRDGDVRARRRRSTLMDAWWPKLRRGGVPARRSATRRSTRCEGCSRSATTPAASPERARLLDGWYGYVAQGPARPASAPKPQGRLLAASTAAAGRRRTLPQALQSSLARGADGDAGSSSTATAGTARPTRRRAASTRTGSTVASAVPVPPFPFQNRPTFQQMVKLTQKLAALKKEGRRPGPAERALRQICARAVGIQETFTAV